MYKELKQFLFLVLFVATPLFSRAQDASGGAVVEPVSTPAVSEVGPATADPSVQASTTSAVAPVSAPRPATGASSPVPAKPVVTSPVAPSSPVAETSVTPVAEAESNNGWLWAALAVVPFGFLVAKLLKKNKSNKKDEDEKDGCMNLKKMLEDKLAELTDLRGQLESKAIDAAKDAVREGLTGTRAGDILSRVEQAEKEYNRIKALFEECKFDLSKRVFKGRIVESSLTSTDILKKVKVEKTERAESGAVHEVSLGGDMIPELAEHIADGPWYIHLWEEGKDDAKVVFKDKTFTIQTSDRASWADALAHAKALGIPARALDF